MTLIQSLLSGFYGQGFRLTLRTKELIDTMENTEEKGRLLASKRDEPISYDDISFLGFVERTLFEASEESISRLITYGMKIDYEELHDILLSCYYPVKLLYEGLKTQRSVSPPPWRSSVYLRSTPLTRIKIEPIRLRGLKHVYYNLYPFTHDLLLGFEKRTKKLANFVGYKLPSTRLAHLIHEEDLKHKYSWSAFLNDITAIYHTFLDIFRQMVGSVKPLIYDNVKILDILVTDNSDNLLTEMALAWWLATRFCNEWFLYEYEDYDKLGAYVGLDRAEFTVGSSANHKTVVTRKVTWFDMLYYDYDDSVRECYAKLCEYYHIPIVEDYKENDYVHNRIHILARGKLFDYFEKVLPFMTSMDFRLEDCSWATLPPYWFAFINKRNPSIPTTSSNVDLECNLCIKFAEFYEEEKRRG